MSDPAGRVAAIEPFDVTRVGIGNCGITAREDRVLAVPGAVVAYGNSGLCSGAYLDCLGSCVVIDKIELAVAVGRDIAPVDNCNILD